MIETSAKPLRSFKKKIRNPARHLFLKLFKNLESKVELRERIFSITSSKGGYDKEEKAAKAYDLAALNELINRKTSGFSRGASMYRGVTRQNVINIISAILEKQCWAYIGHAKLCWLLAWHGLNGRVSSLAQLGHHEMEAERSLRVRDGVPTGLVEEKGCGGDF
ncbi:hypothetical protein G4B88_003392 [Cannabis sativa]|uniref:Uncharacterized protein n=1 Tax=Cannabis sativa TaxID=3483 RepID=A0A7J6E4J5_CANSA|nr:hypothetical protein G4B88_003392 [Cannabis sativa]